MDLGPGVGLEGLCPRCLLEGAGGDGLRELESLVGRVVDAKYRVERLLGRGGMGAVFLATHLGTERTVALQVLAPHLVDDEEFVERFRREARAAGRLRHPNIVNVTDFGFAAEGEDGPLAYLVMEYLDGTSLAEYIAQNHERPRPWVAGVVEQIASAVDEAHRQGVIHRDLKPGNIWLVPDGRGGHLVKVLDFGLAKLRGGASTESDAAVEIDSAPTLAMAGARPAKRTRTFATWMSGADLTGVERARATLVAGPASEVDGLTRFGAVLGTPLYMSPEQCRGDALDGRSDVYSLGIIAYELLTGLLPFKGTTPEVISQQLERAPALLSTMNSKLPKSIDEVLMPALAKSPADRPATAAAFASSLTGALQTSAEKSEMILSQAIALYATDLPLFIALSPLTGLMPFALSVAAAALVYRGGLFGGGLTLAIALMVVGWYLGHALNAGLVVPLAARMITRPNEKVRDWKPIAGLVARLPVFVLAPLSIRHPKQLVLLLGPALVALFALWVEVEFSAIMALASALSGFIVATHFASVLSSVALLERRGIGATSRRACALTGRLSQVFSFRQFGSETLLTALFAGSVALGALVFAAWLGVYSGVTVSSTRFAIAWLAVAAAASLVLNPVLAIGSALRYLKARKLGGESLENLATLPPATKVLRMA
jgi:serine/threonine protein kinase